MRDLVRKAGIAFLALAATLIAADPLVSGEARDHGWERSGDGFWGDRPEVHAGFSDNGIALELKMPPGTAVAYSRAGSWSSDEVMLKMSTDSIREGGNEYLPGEAKFPVSVTFVYGKDGLPLGTWARFKLFFRQLKSGFRPSGIRLTYAWGTRLPVGSMYRLYEEETVFILAGREEAGKEISSARKLATDFLAAYGRPPKGPVTKVVVEARRPSGEKGPANTSIMASFAAD